MLIACNTRMAISQNSKHLIIGTQVGSLHFFELTLPIDDNILIKDEKQSKPLQGSNQPAERYLDSSSQEISFMLKKMPGPKLSLFHCLGFSFESEDYERCKTEEQYLSIILAIKKSASQYLLKKQAQFEAKGFFTNKSIKEWINIIEDENYSGGDMVIKILEEYYQVEICLQKVSSEGMKSSRKENSFKKRIILIADMRKEETRYGIIVGVKDKKEYCIFNSEDENATMHGLSIANKMLKA